MRLRYLPACGLALPLLLSAFAQSTAQSTAQSAPAPQQTAPAPSAPAQQPATPPLQLHDLPAEPHTLTAQEEEQQKAERMRAQLTRIASAQANWGPAISTPGASLALKEIGRKQTPAGTELTYQITARGFTPDMQLTLLHWSLNQAIAPVMSGIAVDASGTAVCSTAPAISAPAPPAQGSSPPATPAPAPPAAPPCSKTVAPGTPITLTTTAAKGEAIRIGLIASDHKHGAALSYVPFLIEGKDRGCTLSVILGSKDAELVLVEGDGLKKDPSSSLGTESYGQKRPLQATINAQGHMVAAITPWIPGHDSGDTVVYYQSSACTPTVSFHWGKGSYRPE